MGRTMLPSDEGLFLPRCTSVHCLFMRMPIDVVALSRDGVVLGIQTVAPWHAVKHIHGTAHIVEVVAHRADGLGVGQQMSVGGLDGRALSRWHMTGWPGLSVNSLGKSGRSRIPS
jgi:uncharacterized membrane protein (UPF0127 family)